MVLQLDLTTIVFSRLLLDIITVLVTFSSWYHFRHRIAGLASWLLAAGLMTFGELCLTIRWFIHSAGFTLLGNGLLLTGMMLLYIGLARISRTPIRRWVAITVLSVFLLVFSFYTVINPNETMRYLIFSFYVLVMMVLSVVVLIRSKDRSMRRMHWIIGSVLVFFFIVYALRMGYLLLHPTDIPAFRSGNLEAGVMLLSGILAVSLTYALILLVNRRLVQQMEAEVQEKERILAELRVVARTDGLTGLLNRTTVESKLRYEHRRNIRFHRSFSIIIIDVDHFKDINDGNGHDVGDKILRQTAAILSGNIRDADILGRWGGEEFMVICLESDAAATGKIAERLRSAVAEHSFTLELPLTISAGYAEWDHQEPVDSLIRRADRHLYEAKAQGRDRISGEAETFSFSR